MKIPTHPAVQKYQILDLIVMLFARTRLDTGLLGSGGIQPHILSSSQRLQESNLCTHMLAACPIHANARILLVRSNHAICRHCEITTGSDSVAAVSSRN